VLRLLRRQAMDCRWMFASENSDSSFVFTGHHPPGRTATAYNALFLSSLFWLPSLVSWSPQTACSGRPPWGSGHLGAARQWPGSSTRCQDSARTKYWTSSRWTAHRSTRFPRQGRLTSGGATDHRSRATGYGGLNQHAWAAQAVPQESRRGGRTMMKLGTLASTGRLDCPARAWPFRPP